MATADLKPNGDGATIQWIWQGSSSHYANIDEDVGSCPDGNFNYCSDSAYANKVDIYNMATTTIPIVVTQVVVHVDMRGIRQIGCHDAYVDINIGGWKGAKAVNYTVVDAWYDLTWAGLSASQSDLDGLQVKVTSPDNLSNTGGCAPISDTCILECMYVTITYTTGYKHKFLGIDPTKIAKISGVPIANIGKIKGV